MSSGNCYSDGCAIDHDCNKLEDGVFSSCAPFAVRGDVFREIFSGSGKDVSEMHLDAQPLDGSWVHPSSLRGGIPIVDRVEIEDLGEGFESDEPLSPKSPAEFGENETSATVRAMLRTSKHEREALIATRSKLMTVLNFMRAKGFTEEEMLKEQQISGFGNSIHARDEFGLPVLGQSVGVKTSSGAVAEAKDGFHSCADQVLGKNPHSGQVNRAGGTCEVTTAVEGDGSPGGGKGDSEPKSWANILKKDIPSAKFQFFPTEKGASLVDPPVDVLKKGNEKFKFCVVGTFSKGTQSYKNVSEFAFHNWKARGLHSVHQKDANTFMFKFKNESGVNETLARGTWYVGRRPMILTMWGHKPGSTVISSIPIWVKLSCIPDCYWKEEGLSRLASVIGEPLGADGPTSKLDILPFAKLQVRYNLGDPLPNEIQATAIDPITEERYTAKVQVSYPVRPLSCSGCRSLGHPIGACPKVSRVWKKKEVTVAQEEKPDVAVEQNESPRNQETPVNIKEKGGECSAAPSHSEEKG